MTQYYNSTNNYESIKDYILNGRSKIERKVAHNTIARIEDDSIIIKYHASDIVELTQDTIKLDSCGYKTPTTKERLNWYLPNGFYLYQDNHVWYIRKGLWNDDTGKIYVFQDGLTFAHSEVCQAWAIYPDTCGNMEDVEKIKSTKKRINTYVKGYITSLVNGKIESPNGGDCLYCHMQSDNKSLGEVTNSTDHLESHFDEKYYVPSMLYNAIRFYPMSPFSNSVLYKLWNDTEQHDKSWGMNIFKDQAKSSLKKFLLREFNIA